MTRFEAFAIPLISLLVTPQQGFAQTSETPAFPNGPAITSFALDPMTVTRAPGTLASRAEMRVQFNVPVAGVDVSDFDIVGPGQITNVLPGDPPAGQNWRVQFNYTDMNAAGTPQPGHLQVAIKTRTGTGGTGIVDGSNNAFYGREFAATPVYELNTTAVTPPVITSFTAGAPTGSSVNFTLQFNTPVTGLDASDFIVARTSGVANATVTNVAGTGPSSYTITVTFGGTGAIQLFLPGGSTTAIRSTTAPNPYYRGDGTGGASSRSTIANVGGPSTGTPDINVLGSFDIRTGRGVSIPSGSTARTQPVDFGDVSASTGVGIKEFAIENTGTATLTLNLPITVTGPHASDFTVTPRSSSTSIGGGNSLPFNITFDPGARGERTATITIGSNDPDENPYTFAIFGTGTSVGAEIDVIGNGVSIADGDTTPSTSDGTDFGSVATGGGSVSTTFTLRNTGTGESVIGGVNITGPNAADFRVTRDPGSPLAAGGSATFIIRFAPPAGATGLRTAEVSILNQDDEENPYNFAIQGTATTGGVTGPEIALRSRGPIASGDTTPSPDEGTDLGSMRVGDYIAAVFQIENIGTAPLNIGTITVTGSPAFSLSRSPTPPTTIAPGETQQFWINFLPAGTTTETATVSIPNNDADENPYTFTIRATGVTTRPPPLAVTGRGQPIAAASTTTSAANGTTFGEVAVGAVSPTETYTITNTGSSPLTILPQVIVTGPHNGEFTVPVQPSFASLAPAATTTFQVDFRPKFDGPRTGIVLIQVSDSSFDRFTFYVSGTGVTSAGTAPEITSPLTASVETNAPFSYTITASNSPTSFSASNLPAGLTFTSPTISGSVATAGTYPITISATNAAGTTTRILQLTVNAPTTPPPTTPPPTTPPPTTPPPTTPPPTSPPPPPPRATQTVSFASIGNLIVGQTVTLNATASSGRPVTLELVSGPGSLNGAALTITGTGPIVVRATQPGDNDFAPASATLTLTAGLATQTLDFASPVSSIFIGRPFQLSALSSAGLPVTFSIVSGNATIDGAMLTLHDSGEVVVRATQAGTETVAPASADIVVRGIAVPRSRVANVSSRLNVAEGDASRSFITGFYIAGTAPQRVLVRVAGPSLASFGVNAPLSNPRLQLFNAAGQVIAENDDWTASDVANTAAQVGAFALPNGSRDAALVATLTPGAYTLHVLPNGGSGIALAEVYDAASVTGAPPPLVNISTRGFVDTGEAELTAGFVITGETPKRVLVRGIGPGLAGFNVPGALVDTVLRIQRGTTVIAQNDNWEVPATGTAADVAAAATATGAFPLRAGSRDAAILITLDPGAYTATVAGAGGTTGAGLVEVYEVP